LRGSHSFRGSRRLSSFVVSLVVLGSITKTLAAPSDDRLLPFDQYTSDKARALAQRHDRGLRALSAKLYHCMPWVEVQKNSVGFFRPKHLTQDDRYVSVRLYVEQDASPAFGKLTLPEQGSAMFSRYVGPLLRRMHQADAALVSDPQLDGYTVILEWLKQGSASGSPDRPIHQTIAAFMARSLVAEFLAGRVSVGVLADGAKVLAWDGETPLGDLRVTAWDDNFVNTYKLANYEPEPGVSCGERG
jgi:hypothetical protein